MRLLISTLVGLAAYVLVGYLAAVVIYQLILIDSFNMDVAGVIVHADVTVGILVGILFSHGGRMPSWPKKNEKPRETLAGPFS
ncbi:MAG TPA: hypothetical protein VIN06_20210 [Devosia sp.]